MTYLGWKIWEFNPAANEIRSLLKGTPAWQKNQWQEATCRDRCGMPVPAISHTCGIHLYGNEGLDRLLGEVAFSAHKLCGLAEMGGRVVGHGDEGMRCQKARIDALLCPHQIKGCFCQMAATTYQVPLFSSLEGALWYWEEVSTKMPKPNPEGNAYQSVLPALKHIVLNEYGSTTAPSIDPQNTVRSYQYDQKIGDNAWWKRLSDNLLSQSPDLNAVLEYSHYLWAVCQIPDSFRRQIKQNGGADWIALMLLLAKEGQENSDAGKLFEYLRDCWRSGTLPWSDLKQPQNGCEIQILDLR